MPARSGPALAGGRYGAAPARLLHWHAEQYGEDYGLTYQEDPVDEHGRHHTRARFTTPEETCLGPRRSATERKLARHQAASALLAQLRTTGPTPPRKRSPTRSGLDERARHHKAVTHHAEGPSSGAPD